MEAGVTLMAIEAAEGETNWLDALGLKSAEADGGRLSGSKVKGALSKSAAAAALEADCEDEDEADGNPTKTQSTRSLPASFRFDLGW